MVFGSQSSDPGWPRAATLLFCLFASSLGGATVPQDRSNTDDLDRFIEQVLTRRDENRLAQRQYVFDEVERLVVTGSAGQVHSSVVREYIWYKRNTVYVRSPVRVDGVTVSEGDWRRYEADWLEAEVERGRDAVSTAESPCVPDGTAASPKSAGATVGDAPGAVSGGLGPELAAGASAGADSESAPGNAGGRELSDLTMATDRPPRFFPDLSWLKFEPGNYYFTGRERLAGREVMRIEYYPERLFGERRSNDAECDEQPAISVPGSPEAFNKNALITLWIDPAEHQIVRVTFENGGFDFMPLRWLVRLEGLTTSITMGRPLGRDWLPERIEGFGVMTVASGSTKLAYTRTFANYRQATTAGSLRSLAPLR